MSKFKFSYDDQQLVLDVITNYVHNGLQQSQLFDRIEQIVSEREQSEPAETGGAEESEWDDAMKSMSIVAERHGYLTLLEGIQDRVKPTSRFTVMELVYQAMTTYAAQRCAEKDREIERLKEFEFMYNGLNK